MDAIGTVTSQAASGSFQAAGENVTRSSETRIVAGRVMEKTNVPNRSAWRFPNRPNRRSPAPITKRRRNSERGEDAGENMGEERNRNRGRRSAHRHLRDHFSNTIAFDRLVNAATERPHKDLSTRHPGGRCPEVDDGDLHQILHDAADDRPSLV